MNLQKNMLIPLTVTGTTAEGNGVGRADGVAVFVPYTAPGDEIVCRIVKVEKTYAYGKIESIVSPSPDRIADETVDCPVFGKCGGCCWRHVRYEAEQRYKYQRVADALSRIGGLDVVPEPIVASERADGYRNKAQYPVASGENGPIMGFYAPRSHRIMEQRRCRLQPAPFGDILDIVADWMSRTGLPAYDEQTKTGVLRHVGIRIAEATGQIQVCLVCTTGKLPDVSGLTAALQAVSGMTSVVVSLNKKDTNVILGDTFYTLWGSDTITDELCGLRFRLSAASFYQVNRAQAERLYTLAAREAALTGKELLLDLYCGTGTIGLSMARSAGQVIGVETVAAAVEDARRNAAENGIANARFLCADAGEAAEKLEKEGLQPDVVIVDPPRKGCGEAVLQTLCRMRPPRIVYISCDPATLARDLRKLTDGGYVVQRVTPVDMFPRTAHVETVALLSQR